MSWYIKAWKGYFDFEGRSTRREYWLFSVVNCGLAVALSVLDARILRAPEAPGALTLVFWIAILCPSIAVAIRRMHDAGRSGAWLLLAFVPPAGLVLLVFLLLPGSEGPNGFGPDPRSPSGASHVRGPVGV